VTVDHSLSAYFEHSVAITAEGPEILTVSRKALPARSWLAWATLWYAIRSCAGSPAISSWAFASG